MSNRPFRFGIAASAAAPGRTWAETARHVESLGYSTLFVPDHFGDQLAPLTAVAMAAAATTSLRVGALVFDNDYRHPVVLAKETATLDLLTEGRVEFGLGSGWKRSDYEESGIDYDPPKVRVDRFIEAVGIIKGLWGDAPVDHQGEHYRITNLTGLPRPHTPGGPPLLIGAGGPRMLRFAGAHADIVGITASVHSGVIDGDAARDSAPDRFDQKLKWLREGAGDRFDDLELNALVFLAMVTDDRDGVAAMMAPTFGIDPEVVRQSPVVLAGTVEQICDDLLARRDRWGLSYMVFEYAAAEAMAPVVAQLAGT